MKYAMVLCLMVVAIGFNSETITATNRCFCPCLTDILNQVSSLTSLTSCTIPTSITGNACGAFTTLISTVAGLVAGVVAIVSAIVSTVVSTALTVTTLASGNAVSTIANIGNAVNQICSLIATYTPSNPIPTDVCTFLDCISRLVINLIFLLICTLIGVIRTVIGSVPAVPAVNIDSSIATITTTIGSLLSTLCSLLNCLNGVPCLNATACYLKDKLNCLSSEVGALNNAALNAVLSNSNLCFVTLKTC